LVSDPRLTGRWREEAKACARAWRNERLSQSATRDNVTIPNGMKAVQKIAKNMSISSPRGLGPSIESAALVDPTRNWPQLVGERSLRDPLDQAAVDHDLAYDALILDRLELRRLSERATGESRRAQKRGRSD